MCLNKFRALLIVMSLCALATDIASSPLSQLHTQTPDPEAIENAFLQYRSALLKGDAAKAAELVDTRTIVYYNQILTNALEMPHQKLRQLDYLSKFMVLRIRHEFNKSQLEKMSGMDLFKIGVDKGWISTSTVANIDRLAKINVDVDLNKATASIPRFPNTPALYFRKESGRWKLALWRSFELVNLAMRLTVEKSGLTEEEFILKSINMLSSKKVDTRILSGPLE